MTFDDQLVLLSRDLRRYAKSLTRNDADADDLVSKTVIRALTNRHQFTDEGPSSQKRWMMTILRNLFLDSRRHSSRFPTFEIDDNTPHQVSYPEQELNIDMKDLYRIVRTLRIQEYLVFTLIRFEGWSHDRVAEALCVAMGTVKSRLHRATNNIRRVMERDDETKRADNQRHEVRGDGGNIIRADGPVRDTRATRDRAPDRVAPRADPGVGSETVSVPRSRKIRGGVTVPPYGERRKFAWSRSDIAWSGQQS